MQPENVNFQPEHSNQSAENPSFGHENLGNGLEVSPGINVENKPDAAHERAVVDSITSSGPLVTSIPVPTVPAPSTGGSVLIDAPLTASDDDIIESKWVEEAKRIVEHTKGDPHAQGNATAALKLEYLDKRYDRTIGSSSEAS